MSHWTSYKSCLDRDFGSKRFGSDACVTKELVAELGCAFICAVLNSPLSRVKTNAFYIASWLSILKNDNKAIFTASAHAQRAADFLSGNAETAQEAA